MTSLQFRKLLLTPLEVTTLLGAEYSLYHGGFACVSWAYSFYLHLGWELKVQKKTAKTMAAVTTHSKFYYWYM